jgi:hypothetical protein
VGLKELYRALKDYDIWPIYFLGLVVFIPPVPLQTYLAHNLTELGFSVFAANMLTIPSYVVFAINLLILSKVSSKVNERSFISSIQNIWMFPFFLALVTIPSDKLTPWLRYGLASGILSYPYCHAILVSWNSQNSKHGAHPCRLRRGLQYVRAGRKHNRREHLPR